MYLRRGTQEDGRKGERPPKDTCAKAGRGEGAAAAGVSSGRGGGRACM